MKTNLNFKLNALPHPAITAEFMEFEEHIQYRQPALCKRVITVYSLLFEMTVLELKVTWLSVLLGLNPTPGRVMGSMTTELLF